MQKGDNYMFNVGEKVLYGTNGICIISDLKEQNFSGVKNTYYVLENSGLQQTIFIPADNTALTSKMRAVLSGEEILEFIRTFPEIQPFEWKEESRKRNEFFKQILSDGDRKNLVRMIKTIYRKKTEQNKSKKKINISDETSFKRAEKIIYSEIAAVMNIDYEAVVPFISETISLCHGPS